MPAHSRWQLPPLGSGLQWRLFVCCLRPLSWFWQCLVIYVYVNCSRVTFCLWLSYQFCWFWQPPPGHTLLSANAWSRSWSVPVATIFCLSGMLSFFPGLPHVCPTNVLRVFSQLAKSGPLPEIQSLSLSTQPRFVLGQQYEQLLTWEVMFGSYLCGEFSPFCLPSPRHCVPLWGSEAPPLPHLPWGVSEYVETFPPLQLSPQSSGPHPEILCLVFLTFIFWPTSF